MIPQQSKHFVLQEHKSDELRGWDSNEKLVVKVVDKQSFLQRISSFNMTKDGIIHLFIKFEK